MYQASEAQYRLKVFVKLKAKVELVVKMWNNENIISALKKNSCCKKKRSTGDNWKFSCKEM